MPLAARVTDATGHGPPLAPGPGCPTVMIGNQPAWRAVPAGLGSALEGPSNSMKSFMGQQTLTPANATPMLVQIQGQFTAAAGAAASQGAAGAMGAVSGAFATLTTANATLTTAWTSASAAPGGQPAANQAYTEGIKAAAGAAATAAMTAIVASFDQHVCPTPVPPLPHGPGVVTRGSSTVVIGNLPAARKDDKVFEALGGSNPIQAGCPTVEIG